MGEENIGATTLSAIQQEILRRFQRPPQPMDETMPDGRSVDEAVQGGTRPGGERFSPPTGRPPSIFAPPQSPAQSVAPATSLSQPPSVFAPPQDTRDRMVNPQPSDPGATRQRAVSFDPSSGEPNKSFYESNPDRLAGSISYRDALDRSKPHGKRGVGQVLKEGLIGAANAAAANPNNSYAVVGGFGAGAGAGIVKPGAVTRGFELNKANADVERQLSEAHARAQTSALQLRPQMQLDAEGDRAMQRYNQLEHYDPDDPADAGTKAYFESRGLYGLPARDKYHRPTVTWSDGRALITDSQGTRQMTVDGQNVTDASRTPDVAGLKPNEAARIGESQANRESRESEGGLNRENRTSVAKLEINAAGERAQMQRDVGLLRQQRGFDNAKREKGAVLIGQIARARAAMANASDRLAKDPRDSKAQEDFDNAKAYGLGAAQDLNEGYGDMYEAGAGSDGTPYYKSKPAATPQQAAPGQLEGTWNPQRFAQAFQVKHKRPPTQAEIDVYAKAANQATQSNPGKIQPSEDPQIRDYANKHFGGDYQKALANARLTGYKK